MGGTLKADAGVEKADACGTHDNNNNNNNKGGTTFVTQCPVERYQFSMYNARLFHDA